jgi:dTDP-4-dehydrorhamnose reductase
MKIAILGVGFLGRKLHDFFSKKYEVASADINPSSSYISKIDATNEKEVESFFYKEKPDIVIDTIALSSYFDCEKNYPLCRKLNFDSAKYISKSCKKYGSKMIFISSSYVFDGEKGDYDETDAPNSINNYAKSKIDAEKIVLKIDGSIVIRLEPIYGFNNEKKQIVFGTNSFDVDVQVGFPNLLRKPIFIDDIPPIISILLKKNLSGIFNIAGPTKLKWLDFLNELSVLANAKQKIKIVDNSSWILKPPFDSTLSTAKIELLGVQTTFYKDACKELKTFEAALDN